MKLLLILIFAVLSYGSTVKWRNNMTVDSMRIGFKIDSMTVYHIVKTATKFTLKDSSIAIDSAAPVPVLDSTYVIPDGYKVKAAKVKKAK